MPTTSAPGCACLITIVSVTASFIELGDMLIPLLIGVLSEAFGLMIGFVACGVLGLLSLLLIRTPQIELPVPLA